MLQDYQLVTVVANIDIAKAFDTVSRKKLTYRSKQSRDVCLVELEIISN